jgi:hypothetical protein
MIEGWAAMVSTTARKAICKHDGLEGLSVVFEVTHDTLPDLRGDGARETHCRSGNEEGRRDRGQWEGERGETNDSTVLVG